MTDQSSLSVERLTQYSHGAGCACKLDPSRLSRVVRGLVPSNRAELLVGPQTGDDAAVWKLDDQRALVVTADFITPVVDDARDWGRVAATNAVSRSCQAWVRRRRSVAPSANSARPPSVASEMTSPIDRARE